MEKAVVQIQLEGFAEVSPILKAGVYALVKNGVVIYVGKSRQVYARLYAHRSTAGRAARAKLNGKPSPIPTWLPAKGFVFDQVFVRPCTLDQLDSLERDMINLYKPRYNESLKTSRPVSVPSTITVRGIVLGLNGGNKMGPDPKLEFNRRI